MSIREPIKNSNECQLNSSGNFLVGKIDRPLMVNAVSLYQSMYFSTFLNLERKKIRQKVTSFDNYDDMQKLVSLLEIERKK